MTGEVFLGKIKNKELYRANRRSEVKEVAGGDDRK